MNDSPRILVIDDNAQDRLLSRRELNQEFPLAEIVELSGPEDLQRELSARNFQLLVTDYDLGWTNGFEILKHVKKRCPEVPVIMFTGTGDQETAVRAMKEGVADYVVKSAMHGTRLRISARTALDHYRQRAILKENEKLAIIGRLTAVIAHEIKNPLDAVSNLLYLTEKDPQKVGEYLPLARREISRIEQITNRTIGFYRQSPKPPESMWARSSTIFWRSTREDLSLRTSR
ncbi:MAG: response regulator [Acidobacteria bacterium]|nr:response regulator [Acidobacteriota bacterium]